MTKSTRFQTDNTEAASPNITHDLPPLYLNRAHQSPTTSRHRFKHPSKSGLSSISHIDVVIGEESVYSGEKAGF